jgi:2-dehydro-3-deoxyglucarate aldolase/4-hydroxy-2-oxoheptanedioate aldolase
MVRRVLEIAPMTRVSTMPINPVKKALRSGGVAVGTMMFEFATTGIARIAAAAGAEFAVFDMEHTGWSMETMRMLMATSRGSGLVPMVRVPTAQYHFIARVLDVGALGVVVPMVADAVQAKLIAESAKYPPVGRRGLAFGIAHDDYTVSDLADGMRTANEEVLLMAQIESPGGVEQADAIAAVEGIDALWIGQYDLTTAMGIPGQFEHPAFRRATATVLDACRRHGKAAVLSSGDVATLRRGPADGYNMLVYLADIWIYQQALRQGLAACRSGFPARLGSDRTESG